MPKEKDLDQKMLNDLERTDTLNLIEAAKLEHEQGLAKPAAQVFEALKKEVVRIRQSLLEGEKNGFTDKSVAEICEEARQ